MSQRFAYTTLVTNADYALGALALARSLVAVKSRYPLVVMVVQNSADDPATSEGLDKLESAGATIKIVKPLPFSTGFKERHSRRSQHARSPFTKGTKPIFHDPLDNFCKLTLWTMDEFERVVFLDADTLVVKNIDRLFGYPEFSAAPNLYESLNDMHRLNSGVFVAQPDNARFEAMIKNLDAPEAYWPRTDQTFLEQYFPDWHGLPYTFNTLQYVFFNLPKLWEWRSINVVHYQYEKPWQEHNPRRAELLPLIDLWHQMLEGALPPAELRTPHG